MMKCSKLELLKIKITFLLPIRRLFWKRDNQIVHCSGLHKVNWVSKFKRKKNKNEVFRV